MKATVKVLIVLALVAAVAGTVWLKGAQHAAGAAGAGAEGDTEKPGKPLPRLLDLGADKCVPCKMMAPLLEELKEEYAGVLEVEFIDVWKDPEAGERYGVQLIPTQIFFDASGEERYRHTGYLAKEDILAKWRELGVDLGPTREKEPAFSRWEPAGPAPEHGEACYLCDGVVEPRTRVVLETPQGAVRFCSPHCYLIAYASMTDESKSHDAVTVSDWATGEPVSLTDARYLYTLDASGRPVIRAFADEAGAAAEQARSGGSILALAQLEKKETANLCGFCDRPVYPEDASVVRVAGMQTWGCCVMCALGVAARTGRDIEVEARDALTGEPVRVTTFEGHVAELDPPTAVAWGGARKDEDGKVVSTGCFKQAFFTSEANLRQWAEANPRETGRQLSIEEALAAKMKLTPEQISKACKIGECSPR